MKVYIVYSYGNDGKFTDAVCSKEDYAKELVNAHQGDKYTEEELDADYFRWKQYYDAHNKSTD